MRTLAVKRLTIYPLALPMKRKVSHAAGERAVSDPVVVAVELMNGVTGYGETLPRPYVTGETVESVAKLLAGEFVKELLALRADALPAALEMIDALPFLSESGYPCPAARAAVELALLDACLRATNRDVGEVAGWLGLPGFGNPGSVRTIRYSVVLASDSIASLVRTVRLAGLYGICNFKLKVGYPNDDERLRAVVKSIGKRLRRRAATLRLDTNGAWSLAEAVEKLNRWSDVPIAAVEQPLSKTDVDDLPTLRERCNVDVCHDESLVTLEDAHRLLTLGVADWFNIRISKCGGLLPAMRLAGFARHHGVGVQLGCMVGETSILSAAGVRFLENVPGVQFAEGAYGGFLMAADIARRSIRFRYAGRPPRLPSNGLGADVNPDLLAEHCLERPIAIEL